MCAGVVGRVGCQVRHDGVVVIVADVVAVVVVAVVVDSVTVVVLVSLAIAC